MNGKGGVVVHIRRRIDLAVLRALPAIAAAGAVVFYLAQVVLFYVDAWPMLLPMLVVFGSWSMSVVNPRYILIREPVDERVRAMLYGIALLAVWATPPTVNAVLQVVAGMPEVPALTAAWFVAIGVGVAAHFVVNAAMRRHVAGLPLVPRRRRQWFAPLARPLDQRLDISDALTRSR